MKLFHYLGWACFIAAILFNIYQGVSLRDTPLNIFHLEFVNATDGKALISSWERTPTINKTTLLHEAIKNTWGDFLFIIGYVSVIIMLSYNQMQREPRAWLNELLRLNFLLAIVAGLLDVTENSLLLYNMAPHSIGNMFLSTYWFALPKFILAGWATVVWLVSLVSAGKQRKLLISMKKAYLS